MSQELLQAPRKGRNPDWSVARSGEAWPCGSEPGVWTEYKPLGMTRFAFREVTQLPYESWPQDWKRSVFIPIPKKGKSKDCSNYHTVALISHASKVMFKIFQARLQQYVNQGLPDVQAGFRKGRGTRDQIANICWIIEKAREFQKNIYFCFIDYAKAFDCVDHNELWKILQEMGIPDHLICLLRNLYADQEATVRNGHRTTGSPGVLQFMGSQRVGHD